VQRWIRPAVFLTFMNCSTALEAKEFPRKSVVNEAIIKDQNNSDNKNQLLPEVSQVNIFQEFPCHSWSGNIANSVSRYSMAIEIRRER